MHGAAVPDDAIAAEIAPCFVTRDGVRTDEIVLACTHYPLLMEQFRRLRPGRSTGSIPRRRSRAARRAGAGRARQAPKRSGAAIHAAIFTSGRKARRRARTRALSGLDLAIEFAPMPVERQGAPDNQTEEKNMPLNRASAGLAPERRGDRKQFRLFEKETRPGPGADLVRNLWMSLDPYMRGRMDEGRSYTANQALDQVMGGGAAGEVVESNDPNFKPGDRSVGPGGWQLMRRARGKFTAQGRCVQSAAAGVFGATGMPGVTSDRAQPDHPSQRPARPSSRSAATGAIGTVVGQLVKAMGARAVGIAGGPEKCAYAVKELGYEACVDHKGRLQAACGCDAGRRRRLFENVGGQPLRTDDGAHERFRRIAICDLIASYEGAERTSLAGHAHALVRRPTAMAGLHPVGIPRCAGAGRHGGTRTSLAASGANSVAARRRWPRHRGFGAAAFLGKCSRQLRNSPASSQFSSSPESRRRVPEGERAPSALACGVQSVFGRSMKLLKPALCLQAFFDRRCVFAQGGVGGGVPVSAAKNILRCIRHGRRGSASRSRNDARAAQDPDPSSRSRRVTATGGIAITSGYCWDVRLDTFEGRFCAPFSAALFHRLHLDGEFHPGLRRPRPDLHGGLDRGGIVERAGLEGRRRWARAGFAHDRRAAFSDRSCASGYCRCRPCRRRQPCFGQVDVGARHDEVGREGRARRLLAMRAMADDGQLRRRFEGIADLAAEAAAGRRCHFRSSPKAF